MAALRSALLGAVTEDNIKALAHKLLEQALAGDLAATKLLLSYTVGKPDKGADPDDVASGADLWRRLHALPTVPEAVGAVMYAVPERVVAGLEERFLPHRDVDEVLTIALTDRTFRAQMEEAQRKRATT